MREIHFIDDFLIAGAPKSEECRNNLETVETVCSELGLPLKWEKVEGPTTRITFLGIILDSERLELRLPSDKVDHLQKTYRTAQAAFVQFCGALQVPTVPTSEHVLLQYIAHLSKTLCHSSARVHLATVRHLHLTLGFQDPLKNKP